MTDPHVKWACEYCTYENWPSAIKCTMCRAQRPGSAIMDGSEHCGVSGTGGLIICPDSSARPRMRPLRPCEPGDHASVSHPDEDYNDKNRLHGPRWSCTMCTYENWAETRSCAVCEHPGPNSVGSASTISTNEREQGGWSTRRNRTSSPVSSDIQDIEPGASLEQTHIFVLAHILRRPIIVYGVKYYKSFRGETLGFTRFQGVYLPLLWEQSFCWKSPIALGYTRGHFSALVAMETDCYDNRGAGANLNTDDDVTVTFLPLVDSEKKLLQIHFLSVQEMGNEEQQEKLLHEWMDCCVTDGGTLAAMQKSSRRRNHPLVTQMMEKWLDGYR
ncbi:hypothetical protein HF521_020951 [Silurus meridionalis]|uniref:ubiquitinyl hydrolase 1 n=1 Tax=Silurus meridionalis TaxID=175797 RepID=A0A8T0BF83_SILME|nr:hypothetical protein HF521_020951 [Silurus meridionalis]